MPTRTQPGDFEYLLTVWSFLEHPRLFRVNYFVTRIPKTLHLRRFQSADLDDKALKLRARGCHWKRELRRGLQVKRKSRLQLLQIGQQLEVRLNLSNRERG